MYTQYCAARIPSHTFEAATAVAAATEFIERCEIGFVCMNNNLSLHSYSYGRTNTEML